ncbi:sensor histidine kinase [Deinococcus ruber]|uniref:HAMP domain-containing protein n=1 Tax=Deinococcus ruber TaxID=1848197 RepID=A0A918CGY8_9DEIO|nr:hypothetical protein [Deinococcus ruber]GGR23698.1 hypothetical protein GCM10008957_39470 [Deinococcus ruber]
MAIPKRTLFLSLRVKLLLSFSLAFTLMFAAVFGWFYTFSSNVASAQLHRHLEDYLATTAKGINGDEFQQLTHFPAGTEPDSPVYRKQQAWLQQLHTVDQNEVSYTVLIKDGNRFQIVGDPLRASDPKHATIFMNTYKLSELQIPTGNSDTNLTPYRDGSGAALVEGYRLISNSKKQVVGAIGVMFNSAQVQEVQQAIKEEIWRVFLLSYLVAVSVVYFSSALLAQPIDRLKRMASRVAQGDYSDNFAGFERSWLQDEISVLGAVFAHMVGQVNQREKILKQEVQGLRIEIDQVRKAKQVEEIVDTDFFQDLKGKAKEMRGRARQTPVIMTPTST